MCYHWLAYRMTISHESTLSDESDNILICPVIVEVHGPDKFSVQFGDKDPVEKAHQFIVELTNPLILSNATQQEG